MKFVSSPERDLSHEQTQGSPHIPCEESPGNPLNMSNVNTNDSHANSGPSHSSKPSRKAIPSSLAETPAMVQTEIWSCLLAYNLIRMKMLQSCAVNGRMPRTLSFTARLQLLANNWLLASVMLTSELIKLGQQISSSEVVGNRPDRVELRANKRRPKILALLNKPRHIARLEVTSAA